MDSKRIEVVKTIHEVLDAASANDEKLTLRMSLVLTKRIDWLVETEEKALRGMERYKSVPTTAANYRRSKVVLDLLQSASDSMIEGDVADTLNYLDAVANPEKYQVSEVE